MKKKYRLLKKKDFQSVLQEKKRYFTNNLVCNYKFDNSIENIKIGIIIPKKKCKRSVDRNYLKRIFWYLNQFHDLKKLPKIKCVFLYNKFFFSDFELKKIKINKVEKELKNIYFFLKKIINEKQKH